jgi:hypothetical protein
VPYRFTEQGGWHDISLDDNPFRVGEVNKQILGRPMKPA